MRRLKVFCIWLCCMALAATAAMAQSTAQNAGSDMANIAAQLKKLQDVVANQQQTLADQQQKIADQQSAIEKLKSQLNATQSGVVAVSATNATPAPHVENAVMTTTGAPATPESMNDAGTQESADRDSPLSFRIGGADFTPGGFVDFTNIFRSTQTSNGAIATNFGAINFSNTVQGHMTENRMTASNSRVSLKVHDVFGANDVTGYIESDFLGNDASSVNVTSNSHTFRMRTFFVDVKRGKWEFLGGQDWGMLTPNRVGMSPYPDDIFYTKNEDYNYQIGLTWTRAPQFRAIYHPNENWAVGVGFENSEQYTGTGEVTLPFAFNAQLGPQLDNAGNNVAPNTMPDITPKITYDTDFSGGRHFHAEAAGLISVFRTTNLVNGEFQRHSTVGGGIQFGGNVELVKDFRLIGHGFWSNGGGRYIFGLGPDVVVLPNAAGTDVFLSTVEADSILTGFEWQATPNNMFSGYYGGAYFGRNFALDTTNTINPNAFAGFGNPNSSNASNRALQEATLGWTRNFWSSKQYGKLQLITQYSYVTRAPWFVAAGAPKNAHLSMGWLNLRYVLP